MCAINGITRKDTALVSAMNAATLHRGPEGTRTEVCGEFTLGQNRLAIIDLSEGGTQPMWDASKRFVIVYNGELYNYRELKAELAGYPFSSESDTEVVLAAWAQWGAESLARLNGIFALALYDKEEAALYLARDRAGIKPLYTYLDSAGLRFSSEIAGILADPSIPRKLNLEAFSAYLRMLYVPAPHTPIVGIEKFPSGHVGRFKKGTFSIEKFAGSDPIELPKDRGARTNLLRETVGEAVRRQLVSDRPVGIYLSGGLDSSIILAEASSSHPKIHTFSASFALEVGEQQEKFNADSVLARASAEFFSSTHKELVIEEKDLPQLLLDATLHLGEPVANPTIAAQLALSRFAKADATVVLTGDGGDELFGGYPRYRLSRVMDSYQTLVPRPVRSLLTHVSLFEKLDTSPGRERVERFLMLKDEELARVVDRVPAIPDVWRHLSNDESIPFTQRLMDFDRATWLVDEALLRTDRLTMAASVEGRTPFLDNEVVRFAEALPLDEKVTMAESKILLRDAYRGLLPRAITSAPKRGWFSPGAKWLRRPSFLAFAREVVSPSYYHETRQLFDWKKIEETLTEHRGGGYHLHPLWAVLTFQLWAKSYGIRL